MNENSASLAQHIRTLLNTYVPDPRPSLHAVNTYTLLIAVLLSARTTDRRVNCVTETLFARATTPEAMIALSVEEILAIIRTIGFASRKARAIHALSAILIAQHQGAVPHTLEELEALPGVGHKTASVVLTQAFHLPAFPVDTHILRCARRWNLSQGTTPLAVEKDLKKCFPQEEWGRIHLQIILFARQYCPARKHNPATCPICCTYTQTT